MAKAKKQDPIVEQDKLRACSSEIGDVLQKYGYGLKIRQDIVLEKVV